MSDQHSANPFGKLFAVVIALLIVIPFTVLIILLTKTVQYLVIYPDGWPKVLQRADLADYAYIIVMCLFATYQTANPRSRHTYHYVIAFFLFFYIFQYLNVVKGMNLTQNVGFTKIYIDGYITWAGVFFDGFGVLMTVTSVIFTNLFITTKFGRNEIRGHKKSGDT